MLDWDDLRFLLAITRNRSLSAAAKDLQVTQTTVGRRLASLQLSLGVRLLQRTDEGYVLTAAGKAIRHHVERVEGEVSALERVISGHLARPGGLVRITSSQLITSHLLAPCFAELHASGHAIMIESLPPLLGEALVAQEADIAIRLRRSDHHDVVVRCIGVVSFGLYGSISYLQRRGIEDAENGCAGHQLITLLDDRELSDQALWLSHHGDRGVVVARADSYETQYAMTVAGGGLAVLPRFRADAEPCLRRLPTAVPVPDAEIQLSVHRDSRDVPRIRLVLDCVAEAIRNKSSVLKPY